MFNEKLGLEFQRKKCKIIGVWRKKGSRKVANT